MSFSYRLGIDVGGTNTDAVVLDEGNAIISKAKSPTTEDVTGGIVNVLAKVLANGSLDRSKIKYAMLGTTHCTNAIVERKKLYRVAVIRIGAPATMAIKPLVGWPDDLKKAIGDRVFVIGGGHEFDGRRVGELDEAALRRIARQVRGEVDAVAVTAVFSPVNADDEVRAAAILREELGDVPISLSHEIGSIGLLERENATVLNAAVIGVAKATAEAFGDALGREGIAARMYFGQNDGTLMSVDYAVRYPILTIACGPTNSIRGAAFLSDVKDALVIDVGGTTTDVGVLVNRFPRESSIAVEIGGVRTNFRMPDLVSIGLGGGTIIRNEAGSVSVGPDSVGYRIEREAFVFGGNTLTATDIAVASGVARVGERSRVAGLPGDLVQSAQQQMVKMVGDAVDRMKTSPEPVPAVLVGGGSILLPDRLEGASEVLRPANFEVANAIGAAIAQVSGQVERIFSLEKMSREEALRQASEMAREEAIRAGADPATVEIVEIDDVPLAYLPGNATRIRVKAAGDLAR